MIGLDGYPVKVFYLILDQDGQVRDLCSSWDHKYRVTELNQLVVNPFNTSRIQKDEFDDFFYRLTKQIRWNPASKGTSSLSALVGVRWEVLTTNEIVFEVL